MISINNNIMMSSTVKQTLAFQTLSSTNHAIPITQNSVHDINPLLNISRKRNNLHHRVNGVFLSRCRSSVLTSLQRGDNHDSNRTDQPSNRRYFSRERDPFSGFNQDGNVVSRLLESSLHFLFQLVALPSILSRNLTWGYKCKKKIELPLIYILSLFGSAAMVPPVTWTLLILFFAAYLSLGMAFMNEYDVLDVCLDENDNQIDQDPGKDTRDDEYNGIIPLSALTGAVASAALLSPQGLVSQNTSVTLATSVAIFAFLLGGLAVVSGIRDLREDEVRLTERNNRDVKVAKEKSRMGNWDDELNRSVGRRQEYDNID